MLQVPTSNSISQPARRLPGLQRSGILIAQSIRIVSGQGHHQFVMQIIKRTRRSVPKAMAVVFPGLIDIVLEHAVEVLIFAGLLNLILMVGEHVLYGNASEAVGLAMRLARFRG